MDFTIEELKNEGKNNIEIAELCNKYEEEINQNIKNIKEILEIIKTKGNLNEQIEQLNGNDIVLNKEKQRLSEIKTFIILSKKNDETDIETLERLIKESEEEKKQIIEKKDAALELIKNIKEICKEDLEYISNYKNGITPKRKNSGNDFSKIIDRNSELNKKLKSYEKFGKFLTEKNKKDIEKIKEEQKRLEVELDKVMPNVSEEVQFIEKKRKIEIIASKDEEVKKYEDLIKKIDDFLNNKTEKEQKPETIGKNQPETIPETIYDKEQTAESKIKNALMPELDGIYEEKKDSIGEEQTIITIEPIEKKIKRNRPTEEVENRKEEFKSKLDAMLFDQNAIYENHNNNTIMRG